MSEEGAEAAAAAPAQNSGFFTGNITKFERPKFSPRLENRPEALRAFKEECGYIFKGSLVNISTNENTYWYKTGSNLKVKRFTLVFRLVRR